MQEKFRVKLYFGFMDLEKAFEEGCTAVVCEIVCCVEVRPGL